MAEKRATKVEKQVRIAKLIRLISNGAVTSELVEFMRREEGVSKSMAHRYIAEAREVLIADINQDRHVVVAEMMAVLRTVIKKGLQKGENLNVVVGAVNSIARMGGLDINPK